MKKALLTLLMMALPASLAAQQSGTGDAAPAGTFPNSVTFPVAKVQTPTQADLYCAGYIGKPVESKGKFVAGGLESPFATEYSVGDAIFLHGSGYEVGQEYTVVRALADPTGYELYPGQWAAIRAAGEPFEELAHIKVVDTRSKMAVAVVEYSCDSAMPGDYVVPFVEKSKIEFHPPMTFDRFAPSNGQVSGRIILAKDFDSELGSGAKVYMNIGANQGLKVGDYMRAERSYETTAHDPVDSLSFEAEPMEPTQAIQPSLDPAFFHYGNGPVIHTAQMPRRAVGEIVILETTPTTATGMIVFAMEPVHVGDRVELDQQ